MPISFEKVSLTAQLAAYMRQFSDIPFARDVAEPLEAAHAAAPCRRAVAELLGRVPRR